MEDLIRTALTAAIRSFGEPDVMALEKREVPDPGSHEVQVRVVAAAVNPVDLTTRAGQNISTEDAHFPMVLGWDVAGVIEAVGDAVSSWRVEDQVAAMTFQPLDQNGTYTQLINLGVDLLSSVPEGVTLQTAASLPLAGVTAMQALDLTETQSGDTLLVNGPMGGVGRFLVQLAAARGVRVVAVVKDEQADQALALGATETVRRGPFEKEAREAHPGGVDAAVDLVGGQAAHSALASVRDSGAYVTTVPKYIDETGPFEGERGISWQLVVVRPDSSQLSQLLDMVAAGLVTSPIQESFPLQEAAEAHRLQARGGLVGKLLIAP